jgi:hypothetical protein
MARKRNCKKSDTQGSGGVLKSKAAQFNLHTLKRLGAAVEVTTLKLTWY